MKRNYFLLLIAVVLLTFKSYSTTYTSAANGNWMNYMTWSPIGVPLPGDVVFINHAVALDTSFAYSTGSITVNVGGSLIQNSPARDIMLNGVNATFTNNGITTLKYLSLSQGSFTNTGMFNVKSVLNNVVLNNSGTLNGVDSLFNNTGTVNNTGTIKIMTFFNQNIMNNYGVIQGLTTVVDSMWNNGTFLNDVGAMLKADSATNNGTFTNNGTIQYNQFTNYVSGVFTNNNSLSFDDMSNFGNFTNSGSMIGAHSMWNNEVFDNTSTGQITLTTSFLNSDGLFNTATFNNDGSFDIGDSFFNFNDITGSATGSFTVQDSSVNYTGGSMTGSFDFCDATPPPTSPYIDINLGSVDVNITYCLGVGINDNNFVQTVNAYPNPTTGMVYLGSSNQFVELYDVVGKQLLKTFSNQINLENYNKGIYYLVVKDNKGNQLRTEKLVKQ